jgi:hypothetical protein
MSSEVSLAVVTAVLGLVTAGVLALINHWVNVRAGVDESLRARRLEHYPALWVATAAVSRWPRSVVNRAALENLHRTLRSWYYGQGGLFLSEQARARYGDVQELIAAFLAADDGNATDVLAPTGYSDLMYTASALRTALTEDLDTRRRKSVWEGRRRSRWHVKQAHAARARIARAGPAAESALWQPDVDAERATEERSPYPTLRSAAHIVRGHFKRWRKRR